MLILNSTEACDELLVKRGATYSDRPALTMAKLCVYLMQACTIADSHAAADGTRLSA